MVSDAQAAAVRDHPGHPVPEVDWEPIWRAGDGAPSDEWAIGRIIRAASSVADGIALRAPGSLSAPAPSAAVGPEATLTREPTPGDDPVASSQAESVTNLRGARDPDGRPRRFPG